VRKAKPNRRTKPAQVQITGVAATGSVGTPTGFAKQPKIATAAQIRALTHPSKWATFNEAYARIKFCVHGNTRVAQDAFIDNLREGRLLAVERLISPDRKRWWLGKRKGEFWRLPFRLMEFGHDHQGNPDILLLVQSRPGRFENYSRYASERTMLPGERAFFVHRRELDKLYPTADTVPRERIETTHREKPRKRARTEKKLPRREPPDYAVYRQKAADLHPEGYDNVKTNVLVAGICHLLGKSAPKYRYRIERALGRRK
jgi:hypothetical protein